MKKQGMFTRDKSFYKTFFALYFPLVLYQIVTLSVNLADNIMIGAYSQNALSGIAAVNQIQFVFMQIIMGGGDALVAMSSQYWGQKDKPAIKRVASSALLFGSMVGVLLFLCASLFPLSMVRIFTDDMAVVAEGVEYLSLIRFTYVLFPISALLLALLRSIETVRIGLYVSLVSLVLNCSLNYTFIFGHFGAPCLGAKGAAVGTLVARAVELLIILFYVLRADKKLCAKMRELFAYDSTVFPLYVKTGWRFMLVSGLFGLSTALQTVILGHMTSDAIAANSAASTLFQVLKVMAVGASSASAVIVGKTIGKASSEEECLPQVKSYAKTLQLMYVCIGAFISISLFLLRTPVLSLYSSLTPEAYRMANAFLLVLCVTGFGTAYQMPTLVGIVRGGGDSKFILYNDLISIWGIVLPMSFLAAFVFHWPPVAVIFCLNADQIFKCGAAFVKVNRYNWMKKIGTLTSE